jgi:predicted nucleic acid-binding protein
MTGRAFFDTNVLIYALAQNDARGARAEALLASGGMVSVQILNEFVSVARRKMQMPWKDVVEALDAIRILCPSPVPLTISTHESALKIAENHSYGIYDALVIAAALESHCATLYSEDLQDGQVIDRKLTIRNPFN